jgi:hypothetical protein
MHCQKAAASLLGLVGQALYLVEDEGEPGVFFVQFFEDGFVVDKQR